jgi:hypothetical protein
MATLGLSLKDVKVNEGGRIYSIVPTGKYRVIVSLAEIGETKSGTSLILGYKIIEGEHVDKQIKDFLNIVNPSEEAVRISYERLKTVAWSTNAPFGKDESIEDTDDLIDKEPFEIFVEQVDDGEFKNMRIKAILCTRDINTVPVAPPEKKAPPKWKK